MGSRSLLFKFLGPECGRIFFNTQENICTIRFEKRRRQSEVRHTSRSRNIPARVNRHQRTAQVRFITFRATEKPALTILHFYAPKREITLVTVDRAEEVVYFLG